MGSSGQSGWLAVVTACIIVDTRRGSWRGRIEIETYVYIFVAETTQITKVC
jgi:hypothetical protein